MKKLRDKAKGINKVTKDGKLLASYLHEDVKEAVFEFEKILKNFDITKLNTIGISDNPYCIISYIQEKFKEIFGDFGK